MTTRLTIERARPGMLVYFADDKKRCPDCFTIEEVDTSFGLVRINAATGDCGWWRVSAFAPAEPRPVPVSEPTLAALLAERAPEFLAACREIADEARRYEKRGDYIGPFTTNLLREIERAGLIAQEPRTTFHLTPQQFQEMWNAG